MDRAIVERLAPHVEAYKNDAESVYNTWFIGGEARLKAFRSIRRGVQAVVQDIRSGRFPNDFKGSSLEFVLQCITEQKQIFEGAAHAFYWKPKLRIPDIYENQANKQAFGEFLFVCLSTSDGASLEREALRLSQLKIKGLGPAVANILYFLHPTHFPAFNTAMVNGFNALFSANKRLGSWESYFEMRETILAANDALGTLSKDLGAVSGLLFEAGSGRLVRTAPEPALTRAQEKLEAVRRKRHEEVLQDLNEEREHTRVQHQLASLGRALGCEVWVARNDRSARHLGTPLGFQCLERLPELGLPAQIQDTVELIDVLWLQGGRIVCAFEVEKSTSIYSGILRLADMAMSLPGSEKRLYLVVPKSREREVLAQLSRPMFQGREQFSLAYLTFEDLERHFESLCRLGTDHQVLERLACRCDPAPRA